MLLTQNLTVSTFCHFHQLILTTTWLSTIFFAVWNFFLQKMKQITLTRLMLYKFTQTYIMNILSDLGIAWNSKRTRKNIPSNIKTSSSWKSGLQQILNATISLFSRWKTSSRRIFFYDFFKDTNTYVFWHFFFFFSENVTAVFTVSFNWHFN